MSKKNSKRNKQNGVSKTGQYRQKVQFCYTWNCHMCYTINSFQNSYCQNCLNSLFYYQYINKHMFVEKDDSYMTAQLEFDAQKIGSALARKESLNSTSTFDSDTEKSQEDEYYSTVCPRKGLNTFQQSVDLRWIDTLLLDE